MHEKKNALERFLKAQALYEVIQIFSRRKCYWSLRGPDAEQEREKEKKKMSCCHFAKLQILY